VAGDDKRDGAQLLAAVLGGEGRRRCLNSSGARIEARLGSTQRGGSGELY
jgi:hypothetical protein